MVHNLPATQEAQVQPLGQEDPLEKQLATHSSVLAWETPWTEEPGGLQLRRSQSHARLTRTFMCGTMESLKKGIISIKVDGETANSPILEHHEA